MTTDRGITTAQIYAALMARSGDEVAAGDGLGAFGATLILPVRMHSRGGRTLAMQWIHEKRSSIEEPRLAENQDHQIWVESTRPPPRSCERNSGALMEATARDQPLGHRSRGRAAEPATPHRPRSGGRRRLADARHGAAVAR